MSPLAKFFRRSEPPTDDVPNAAYPDYPSSHGSWGTGMVWKGDGLAVDTGTAMLSSAVYACLRLLSEAISTLPLDTYRADGNRRTPYPRPRWLDFALPGPSLIDVMSQVMLSLLTAGNAYAFVVRVGSEIVELSVLDPAKVSVSRRNRVVYYTIAGVEYTSADVLHIAGMKLPGAIAGVSPITYARETLALDRDARRFGQSFFANGALPGAVIEAPDELSDESAEMFAATWNGSHKGVGNANRIGVLTGGAKLTKVSISPEDSQFLQTRQFSIPDIARIYGVPPHLIGDATNSTSWGSGLAEQNLAFGQFSLRPWTTRVEDALTRLLVTDGHPEAFVKFNLDALLRASLKDRYDADAVGIASGVLQVNEARAWEELPPLPETMSKEQADALGSLVRSGFEPDAACAALGLPPIAHTGQLPVTVQAEG